MRVKDTKISCPLGKVKHLSYGRITPSVTYTSGYTEKVFDESIAFRGRIIFEEETVVIPAKHPLLVFEESDAWYVKHFDMSATIITPNNFTETDIFKDVFVTAPQKLPSGEYFFPRAIDFRARIVHHTKGM